MGGAYNRRVYKVVFRFLSSACCRSPFYTIVLIRLRHPFQADALHDSFRQVSEALPSRLPSTKTILLLASRTQLFLVASSSRTD